MRNFLRSFSILNFVFGMVCGLTGGVACVENDFESIPFESVSNDTSAIRDDNPPEQLQQEAIQKVAASRLNLDSAYLASETTRILIPAGTEAQQYSHWCWAAVMQSFLSVYGLSLQQCDIVLDAAELRLDELASDCCMQTMAFDAAEECNLYNTLTGDAGSVSELLRYYGYPGEMIHDALTFDEIVDAVSENRPLIAQWIQMGASAHFVVINGVMVDEAGEQFVYFFDPWPGEGASIASYEWLRGGTSDDDVVHVWMKTIVGVPGSEFSCSDASLDSAMEWTDCSPWDDTAVNSVGDDENEQNPGIHDSYSCAVALPFRVNSNLWMLWF